MVALAKQRTFWIALCGRGLGCEYGIGDWGWP